MDPVEQSLERLMDQVLETWERMKNAHDKKRGVRISYEELRLMNAIDGFVMERFGQVEDLQAEREGLGNAVREGAAFEERGGRAEAVNSRDRGADK